MKARTEPKISQEAFSPEEYMTLVFIFSYLQPILWNFIPKESTFLEWGCCIYDIF